MNHAKKAEELFLQGYNCAQAVYAAFSDVTGMDEPTALRLSSSFGGGMGRMREVCGAVSAMFMVAGHLWGYDTPSDDKIKKDHYALIQKLAADFKEKHATILCRELLSALKPDSNATPSERTAEYYHARPCLRFVVEAATILDEMIQNKA